MKNPLTAEGNPHEAAVAGSRDSLDGGSRIVMALEPDPEVAARLREWRYFQARQEHVPTYVVMPNALLLELARVRPTNAEELELVRGMGALRMMRYGEPILQILRGEVLSPPEDDGVVASPMAAARPATTPRPVAAAQPVVVGEAPHARPLAPTPFTVAMEYSLSEALCRRLVEELQGCGGPVASAVRQVLHPPVGRVTLRVETKRPAA